MSDDVLPSLFSEATPPARPMASPEQIAALLDQLRGRRRELIDALAVGLGPDEPLPPSSVAPLAAIETAIQAVQAAVGEGDPGRPPAAI